MEMIGSEMSARPLFGGQDFQAGCPPADQDRFDKFHWELLLAHFVGQSLVFYPALPWIDD